MNSNSKYLPGQMLLATTSRGESRRPIKGSINPYPTIQNEHIQFASDGNTKYFQ